MCLPFVCVGVSLRQWVEPRTWGAFRVGSGEDVAGGRETWIQSFFVCSCARWILILLKDLII